jgi:hypothetical protein
MQAIVTKYISATDTKGARIKATCAAGSITVPFPHEWDVEAAHAAAAMALVRKLGWESRERYGDWVAGGLPDTSGFVFVSTEGCSWGAHQFTNVA